MEENKRLLKPFPWARKDLYLLHSVSHSKCTLSLASLEYFWLKSAVGHIWIHFLLSPTKLRETVFGNSFEFFGVSGCWHSLCSAYFLLVSTPKTQERAHFNIVHLITVFAPGHDAKNFILSVSFSVYVVK